MTTTANSWDNYAPSFEEAIQSLYPYQEMLSDVVETTSKYTSTGARILDAGCGTGNLLQRLREARTDYSLTGIDSSKTMLGIASTKKGLADCLTLGNLTQNNSSFREAFDIVTCVNVLYAMDQEDRNLVMTNLLSYLKPGGRLIIVVPHQDASIIKVVASHVRRSTIAQSFPLIFKLLKAGFGFIKIISKVKKGSYTYFSPNNLSETLPGGEIVSNEKTYANQNLLIVMKNKN